MVEREEDLDKKPNFPENQSQPEKSKDWKSDFAKINQALTETNLIPQLHELFTQTEHVPLGYLTLDGYESARGFPVPVLTRYILPVFEQHVEDIKSVYPGLLVSEIHGLEHRTIEIQMGLDNEDFVKYAQRAKDVTKKEGDSFDIKPEWWTYPYKATDMTRNYNLAHRALFGGEIPTTGDISLEAFIWGKAETDKRIVSFDFERERRKVVQRVPHEEEEQCIEKGLSNLGKIIADYPKQI